MRQLGDTAPASAWLFFLVGAGAFVYYLTK